MERSEMHTHITSKVRPFELRLNEVWRYRDLIKLFTKRAVTVKYRQTILGPAWLFIVPLLTSFINMIVFGDIAGIGTDGVPKFLFYLTGIAFWTFFANCLTSNAAVFTENAHLFGKVYFPRLTVPISNMLSSAVRLGIQLIIVAALVVFYLITSAIEISWTAIIVLPVAIAELGLLGSGIGIIISSMTTKYKDLNILVSFIVQLLMYAAPVVYPISAIPDGIIKTLMTVNPVTAPMEMIRCSLFGSGSEMWLMFAVSLAVTAVITVLGIAVFNRVERNFTDTV